MGEDINTSISVDLSSYNRSMDRALDKAYKFDDALDSISNAKLTPIIDISSGNLDEVKRQIESALDGSYSPDLTIDDSAIKNAQSLIDKLDGESASVKITANDADITTIDNRIDDLSRTESVKVDVTGDPANDGDITALQEQLEQLKLLAAIEIGVNLAGSIPTPDQIPILGSIVAAADAAKQLEASLGSGFRPAQAQLTTDVYTSGLAGSQSEAAGKVAATIQTIGNEAGNATTTSEDLFATIERGTYTAQLMGAEYEEVLRSTKILVDNGLVPSFEAGFDLLVKAQQEGVAASGDLLDSINEYVPQLKLMGFTAEESMNIFNTAMKSGVFNLDKVNDLIKETNIRVQEGIADAESTPGKVLAKLGLADEAAAYAAGEISGAAFMQGLSVTAKSGLEGGVITQQDLFDLLGSPGEDLTIPVALEILGTGGAGVFGDTAGAADKVSDLLGTGLDASITTAQRLIETKVADSINKAFDIQGKIDDFNAGISEFADLVQGGESITGAIEKAFNLPGLEDSVNRLESAIGNLVIELATIGANIVEGLGNKGAADDIRAGVRDMSEQQLTFDLTLARDGEDVTAAVATAVRRGVESDEVGAAMAAAGSEMLAAGDLQGLQEYVGTLESLADASIPQPVLDVLAGRGIDVTNLQAVNAELKEIQANASTGMANADWNVVQLLQSQGINLSEVAANLDYAAAADEIAGSLATDLDAALFTKFNDLFSGGKFLEGFITAIGAGEGGTAGIFGSEIVNQFKDLPNQLMTGLADLGGDIPLLSTLQTDLDTTNTKVGEVMPIIGESINANGKVAFDAFTTAVNATAAAMLSQVPVIGEQNSVMQEGLIATSEEMDNVGISAEGLNAVGFGTLMGSFAALRASAEDQLGYINLQIALLQAGLGALSGFSIDIPGIAGRSGGAHMYGGVIPQGTIGRVHGNEIMAAAPAGTDISVLNQQTSSTIESALASLVGGGAGGGGVSNVTYNNQFVYNVQSNAQGFMSEGAARSARGF